MITSFVPPTTNRVRARIDALPGIIMCRNIRTLFNFEPPATEQEIRNASLQFVRKLSGFNAPSKANAEAFSQAVDDITEAAGRLIASLVTTAEPKDREVEALKVKARSVTRPTSAAR